MSRSQIEQLLGGGQAWDDGAKGVTTWRVDSPLFHSGVDLHHAIQDHDRIVKIRIHRWVKGFGIHTVDKEL
jgi:hypothetical protein